jgi:hypothetical protein
VARIANDALRQQESRHQLEVMARRPHRYGDRFYGSGTVRAVGKLKFQGLFYGQKIRSDMSLIANKSVH